MFIVQIILRVIMFLVKTIRHEHYHYLSAPEGMLPTFHPDKIMKFGHALPSLVFTIVFVIKVLPLVSDVYAKELERNGILISETILLMLVPVLILNGFLIEWILNMTNAEYRCYKKAPF